MPRLPLTIHLLGRYKFRAAVVPLIAETYAIAVTSGADVCARTRSRIWSRVALAAGGGRRGDRRCCGIEAIGPTELGLHRRPVRGHRPSGSRSATTGMLTHRAFESSRAFRAIVAVARRRWRSQGSVITWVADHRKHHAFTDQKGDPHSPHLSGPGFAGRVKGLWHAHVGWLFETVGAAERERFAPDLVKDRMMARDRPACSSCGSALSFVVPFAPGLGDRRQRRRGVERVAVGRPGSRVPAAPRDLVDQLRLPLLGPSPLRRRGRVAQRLLARADVDGRGVAPQSSCLPDLGVPRASLLGTNRRPDRAA